MRTPPRCSRANVPTRSASGCTYCARSPRAPRPPSRRCARRQGGPARAALRKAQRRTCAVRSRSHRPVPPRKPTCGSSSAWHSARTCIATPTTMLHESDAVATAVTPVQRAAIALSGARALGLIGHFDRAFALCAQALDQAEAYPADLRERLEAELAADGCLHVSTIEAGTPLRPRTQAGAVGARAVAGGGCGRRTGSRTSRRARFSRCCGRCSKRTSSLPSPDRC